MKIFEFLKEVINLLRYKRCGRCKGLGKVEIDVFDYERKKMTIGCSKCDGTGFIKIF